MDLLFLYDFGHFMKELHLFVEVFKLSLSEIPFSANEPPEDPLNEPACIEYGLIVPFDFQHPPVLLYVNCCLLLFVSVLLCLSIITVLISIDERIDRVTYIMSS